MNINADKVLEDAIVSGLKKAVEEQLSNSYRSPVEPLIKEAIEYHKPNLSKLLNAAIGECVTDEEFCIDMKSQVKKNLAKMLVRRFGGEIEKQVNALKSDPTTRARIVMAIEEIVDSKI